MFHLKFSYNFIIFFLFLTNSFSSAKPLEDSVCLQKTGNKPATEKACDGGKDCAQWHTGSWKPVRKTFHSKKEQKKC